MPEWLGSGLQNRVHGFDSRRRLHILSVEQPGSLCSGAVLAICLQPNYGLRRCAIGRIWDVQPRMMSERFPGGGFRMWHPG